MSRAEKLLALAAGLMWAVNAVALYGMDQGWWL